MVQPTRGRSRLAALGTALTVVVATLSLGASAPAHADDPVGKELRWKVSNTFAASFSSRQYEGGASADVEGVVTFPDGTGSYDSDSGAVTMRYQGSVRGAFVAAGAEQYHVRIADPWVTVDETGLGEITAIVSAANVSGMGAEPETTDPARVIVTQFDVVDGSIDSDVLSATPRYAGVLPAGSPRAVELGITNPDRPVDGQSFHPDFLEQITSGVRARFYATTGDHSAKAPSPFSAHLQAPSVTVTTTSADADGLALTVSGVGFTAQTNGTGSGVYIGLAESGGLPDTSSIEGQDAFAGSNWVMPPAIQNGSFTSTIFAAAEKLDPATSYSVYTWRAHVHDTDSQDTETPVEIDFDALKQTSTLTVDAAATAPYGATTTVTVTATPATATGAVTLTGAGPAQTRTLTSGKATFTLPRTLTPGAYTLAADYSGDAVNGSANATRTLRVAKAATRVRLQAKKRLASAKRGRAAVRVVSPHGIAAPRGSVVVRLAKGKQKRAMRVALNKKGRAVVRLPKLPRGTWRIIATYRGNALYAASRGRVVTRVAR